MVVVCEGKLTDRLTDLTDSRLTISFWQKVRLMHVSVFVAFMVMRKVA